MCGFSFDEAGRNCVDPNALRTEFLRQSFAVRRQRCFGGRVSKRCLEKREPSLDGRDVDDDAGTPLEHSGNECAIQTNCGEQVEVHLLLPVFVGEGENAAARRAGAANTVNENVEATETLEYLLGHLVHTLARADISLNEQSNRLPLRQG